MSRTDRLDTVRQVAQRKTEQAATGLSQAREQLNHQKGQLLQLKAYRKEYSDKLANSGPMGVTQMLEFRRFIARLDEAVKSQEQVVENFRQQLDRARGDWVKLRAKEQAVETLIERNQQMDMKRSDRLEQLANDERAARLYISRGRD